MIPEELVAQMEGPMAKDQSRGDADAPDAVHQGLDGLFLAEALLAKLLVKGVLLEEEVAEIHEEIAARREEARLVEAPVVKE